LTPRFLGHEKVEDLTHRQLTLLYAYPWTRNEKNQAKVQQNNMSEAKAKVVNPKIT
jgi:hypothetical protein